MVFLLCGTVLKNYARDNHKEDNIQQQTSAKRSSQIRRSAIAFKLIRWELLLLANLMRQLTQSIKQSPTTWSKCSSMTANSVMLRLIEIDQKNKSFNRSCHALLQQQMVKCSPCSTFSNALSTIDSNSSSAAAVKIIKTLRHPDFMLPTLDFIICSIHQHQAEQFYILISSII